MAHPDLFRDHFREAVEPPGNIPALRAAVAAEPGAVMLESTAGGDWGRYSVYAMGPVEGIGGEAGRDPFAEIGGRTSMERYAAGAPFAGGWFGYLAYEAGRWTEPAAGWRAAAGDVPLAQWGLYESALVHDHATDEWLVVGADLGIRGGGRAACTQRWRNILFESSRDSACVTGGATGRCIWIPDRETYLRQVEHVLAYIRAGDVYQVNLARRMRMEWGFSPEELYGRLCAANPATHASFVSIGPGAAIVSASPELFLDVRDGVVTTRPIKGTRPRTGDAATDERARRELATSEKDRAELNMIIDLQRNDLGRVCEAGSVRVENDGEIETLPTVFHRTATVTGRLRGDCSPAELLRATFPGGSVTGAPKVRAMQIIQEMEPFLRGPYCGAIGWIGGGGDMTLSLPIRTLVVHDGVVDLFVGSGIVADSDPEGELAELEAKASGMMAAILGKSGGTTRERTEVAAARI